MLWNCTKIRSSNHWTLVICHLQQYVAMVKGHDMKTEIEITKKLTMTPFAALAFKSYEWSICWKISFFRVYAGQLEKKVLCIKLYKDKKKLGRILQMHANKRRNPWVYCGDIAAAVGLKIQLLGILFVMKLSL